MQNIVGSDESSLVEQSGFVTNKIDLYVWGPLNLKEISFFEKFLNFDWLSINSDWMRQKSVKQWYFLWLHLKSYVPRNAFSLQNGYWHTATDLSQINWDLSVFYRMSSPQKIKLRKLRFREIKIDDKCSSKSVLFFLGSFLVNFYECLNFFPIFFGFFWDEKKSWLCWGQCHIEEKK